ncbi:hypothetical protein IEQ34_006183 [Dendrobium chrysotoxum]|uniref:RINT1-like protein n=1 Tax=Dendrobium chrysotoxum TaxID=161865 RepID=A0AAV7GW19_DENCH|nr:hypothetical protein IEQ34_006183 [Dendrobium chrysotoxum]
MGTPVALPGSGGIPCWLLGFLQDHFREPEDLSSIQSLTARLKQQCDDHEVELLHLKRRLSLAVSSWISQSNEARRILSGIESGHPCSMPDESVRSHEKILLVELPLIAKEVGRIQSVRLYAESALRLETLVGDLEDATLSMMKQVSRKTKASNQTMAQDESGWRLAKQLVAVKAMKDIEEVLAGVANNRPWWTNLLQAVDSRVDKALAILRPQCLTDYRILIASLGWPPALSATNVEKDNCMEMQNPLFLMQGEKKARYSQSFLVLCSLQQLQAKREARSSLLQKNHRACNPSDFKDVGEVSFFKYGLWPIDELVNPIALRMEYHFSRWLDQPKFIFALVYKITQNFLDGVENILQPFIDNARILGCSAKEAWVLAMMKVLLYYLERQVFPALIKNHCKRDADSGVTSSLLHMVDLMITFDRRMKILSTSGIHVTGSFAAIEGFVPSFSIMSMFNDHSDWLQIWAEMEVKDAEGKLKPQLEDETSWLKVFRNQAGDTYDKEESFLFLSREDYKAPLIADSVFHFAWAMIERGLSIPCMQRRNQFFGASANLFLSHFFNILVERSRDVEFMVVITDDIELLRICSAINIACYCEHVLQEWSEDVNLMEMGASGDDAKGMFDRLPRYPLFDDGIMVLVNLQTDCLEEILTALLLHFDNLSWNYVQDSGQWEMKQVDSDGSIRDEEYLFISPTFIEALDMLRDRIQFLKQNLNPQNFLDLWRSIAGGLDHFIFTSIPMSNASFSCPGINQFRTDMKALFLIFKPFCARPEAFFPCISNSLKLLEINKKDADQMLKLFSQGHTASEDCLRLQGLFQVSPSQAKKVLRNRMRGD